MRRAPAPARTFEDTATRGRLQLPLRLLRSDSATSSARDQADDQRRELGAGVLLDEVAAALDRRVGLARGTGDLGLEHLVGAARDRIGVAERGDERSGV